MFEAQIKPMTLDEFIAFALLPENAERNLEFINGEIMEKIPSSTRNSTSAFTLGHLTQSYCETNDLPLVTMATYGINDMITVDVIAGLTIPVSKLFR